MNKHFLTFLLVFILLSCRDETIPEDILSVDKMAAILVDIHLAEGKVDQLDLKGDTARMVFYHFEDEIFRKHQVEKQEYKKSFAYHFDNVKSMDQIYSRVVDSLNVRRQLSKID